jgi:hypothetical protein
MQTLLSREPSSFLERIYLDPFLHNSVHETVVNHVQHFAILVQTPQKIYVCILEEKTSHICGNHAPSSGVTSSMRCTQKDNHSS